MGKPAKPRAAKPREPTTQPLETVMAEIKLAPGHIPTTNTPLDAPTFYADAVQGIMLSDFTVKVWFLEQWVPSGQTNVIGRYSHSLVMPAPQLRALGTLFGRLADEADKQKEADGSPEPA